MINVLVIDDHDIVRAGIRRILDDASDIKVVGEGSSGEEGIKLIKPTNPDVVLMDIKMPGIGGLETARRMLRLYPDSRIIILTAYDEDPYPSKLLHIGVSGYLTKGASPDELVRAIRMANTGQRYISPEIAQQLALKPYTEQKSSPFDVLSAREVQISLMLINCRKVQTIAEQLCLSPKTINSYRYRIFEKLGITSDVELAILAIRHGMLDL